jgi:hypothetical protein
MNVAPRQVERARVVHQRGDRDVRDALDRGRISASAAEGIARLPDEAQPEAVAVALPNGARAIMSSRHEPDDSLDFFPTPPIATADHAFECRDLWFVLLKKVGRAGILIKGPSLKLLDPDSDQVARDVVAFGETVDCLARNEVLGDLSFELDAMGAVLGHGFHPLKARQRRSIPNLQTVHRQGHSTRGSTKSPNFAPELAPEANGSLCASDGRAQKEAPATEFSGAQGSPLGV